MRTACARLLAGIPCSLNLQKRPSLPSFISRSMVPPIGDPLDLFSPVPPAATVKSNEMGTYEFDQKYGL